MRCIALAAIDRPRFMSKRPFSDSSGFANTGPFSMSVARRFEFVIGPFLIIDLAKISAFPSFDERVHGCQGSRITVASNGVRADHRPPCSQTASFIRRLKVVNFEQTSP
jgi:hypothetical protein